MARDIYIDCTRRDPAVAIEAVRRHVQALRPGASCIIVLVDDRRSIEAVADWADHSSIPVSARGHSGYWALRLFVLPRAFGALPPCVQRERSAEASAA